MVNTFGNNIINAYTGGVQVKYIYSNGVLVWPTSGPTPPGPTPTPANNEIFYTSSDGQVITPASYAFIGNGAFANIVSNTYSNGLGIIVLDIPVVKINTYSFENRTKLTSIVIPSAVTIIGESAFAGCTGLTSVTIPSSVTTIQDAAFSISGGSLVSITIPSSVTSIGTMGLNTDSLTTIIVNNTVPPTLGNMGINFGIVSGGQIRVPSSSVQAYKTATNWNIYASVIVSQ